MNVDPTRIESHCGRSLVIRNGAASEFVDLKQLVFQELDSGT